MADFSTPLNVSVVGAGIAGLAAAIALRKNGHAVQVCLRIFFLLLIFESSENKGEIGAALGVPPNASRVLDHFGVVRNNLNADLFLARLAAYQDLRKERGDFVRKGSVERKSIFCHRSDVHDELMRLAIGEGEGTPVQLHLGRKVIDCRPGDGMVILKDGGTIEADLIIGADGLHSTIRSSILGRVETAPVSGFSCFRSLVDSSKLQDIADKDWFTEGISGMRGLMFKGGEYRLIVMYPCRNGTLINIVGIYEDPHQDDPGWASTGTREELLNIFHDAHPKFLAFLALADSPILKWQLRVLPLLDTWTSGRAALVGDAAHATLPTLGQGAALAVEEAGALGCLLPPGTRREDVPSRLEAYQTLRKPRGDYVNREALEQATIPSKRGLYLKCALNLTVF
ncbi:FAD/NAD(P)-binding domain-containing protein [Mycena polygramma]|nr:FAD/NAD(P)-binding domain-containing protein [Mycena polygramma]